MEVSDVTMGNDTSLADLPSVFSSESDKKTPDGKIEASHLDKVKANLKKSSSDGTTVTDSTTVKGFCIRSLPNPLIFLMRTLSSDDLTDIGEDSKLVYRRKRPKVDASIFLLFFDAFERRI